jgi:hypothetical protein
MSNNIDTENCLIHYIGYKLMYNHCHVERL